MTGLSSQRDDRRLPTVAAVSRTRVSALGAALILGVIAGAIAARKPTISLLLCLGVLCLLALAALGDRAFPWALVAVAVMPWYPFTGSSAQPPLVRQLYLCIAIVAAPLIPWLWSLASGGRRSRPSRMMILLAILSLSFFILVYSNVGLKQMVQSGPVGFLIGGVTFLCARRFIDPRAWMGACFGGLAVLGAMGAAAFAMDPGDRVGSMVGHGITYGALVVSMLPGALVFAGRRSRLLAVVVAVGGATLLILSQSRSSWLATIVIVLFLMVLLARRGDLRLLGYLSAGLAIALVVIFSTGSLHRIVETRLNSDVGQSQAVTHRQFSLSFAGSQIRQRPLFGAGTPGYAAQQIGAETDLGAVDNGYLSIGVDLGLLGLLVALFPLAIALRTLGRCLRLGLAPPVDLALALGILGVSVITLFYDTYYWAQLDLMLFGMGGVLSARLAFLPNAPLSSRVSLRPQALPRTVR